MKMVLVFDTDDASGMRSSMKIMQTILREYSTQWSESDPKFGKIEFIKMLRDLQAYNEIEEDKGQAIHRRRLETKAKWWILQSTMEGTAPMRKQDAWGNPILRVGDIVKSTILDDDPGTVTKIVQVNANGAYVVAVKWFSWNNSATSEEYVNDLKIVSGA